MPSKFFDKLSRSFLILFVLTLGGTIIGAAMDTSERQMVFTKLFGGLTIAVVITLAAGFLAIFDNQSAKYGSLAIMTVRSVWSLGILTLALLIKSHLLKYALKITWCLTIVSGLAVLSLYFFWVALLLIPFSLFLCYIKLKFDSDRSGVMLLIVINLILCGVISSFAVSAGLWK